jgi:hypothetical protein
VEVGEGVALEDSGSRGAYTLYEKPDSDDSGTQVYVSNESVLTNPTEAGLDVAVDDQQSIYQASQPFRWLVRNAGDGDIVAGSYKPV